MPQSFLSELCSAPAFKAGGFYAGLFFTGLAGSITHCTGMCGPFVLALSGGNGLTRARGGVLLPYHVGRITTYAGLGMAASGLAVQMEQFLKSGILPGLLLLLGAALFLAQFLGFSLRLPLPSLPRALERALAALGAKGDVLSLYISGVILGFLPCGLLLSALLMAASASRPLEAGFGMALFGVATMPALGLTLFLGRALCRPQSRFGHVVQRGFLLAGFLTLFLLAGGHFS